MTSVEDQFRRTIPASAREATAVRHAFVGWLTDHRVNGVRADDWSLVLSELVTNACTASPAGGYVDVHATFDYRVTITVRNQADGTVPQVGHVAVTAHAGRGLMIAERLTDSLVFDVNGDDVTVVCWALVNQPETVPAAS